MYILSSEDHAPTTSDHDVCRLVSTFTCLDKLLRKKGVESQFAPFHELLAVKTFSIIQNRSYNRQVRTLSVYTRLYVGELVRHCS